MGKRLRSTHTQKEEGQMEVLIRKLQNYQQTLEDTLRLETTPEEIQETKYGKRLLKYVRRRRRAVDRVVKILSKI